MFAQGDAVSGTALTVSYTPAWPAAVPSLRIAETLTLSKFGLPDVRNQKSAEVLYQQSIAKGGTTNLTGVYKYAEPIDTKGFVFMDSPGFDPASITGEVASGANLVCFTTGRGSVYGCKPAPSIKLATNTPVYERMIDDMDINCGDVLDGVTIQEKGQEIFEHILKIASGERSKSEKLGYGDAEFVPWQIGATM